jgi:hypothetical protein
MILSCVSVPGLVGTEHVHRAKVLDGVEALHHDLALGHGDCTFRQVGADQHGQHFWREADRDRDGEQEGLEPIAFGEAVDHEDHGHHDQHEADEHPGHAVDAALEARWRPPPDDRPRQRSEIGASAGGDHHRGGGAAHHIRAEEADIGAFEDAGAAGVRALGGLFDGRSCRVVFLDRQRLTGQRGLTDEDVAGSDQPNVGRNQIAGTQPHYVAGNEFGDRYFPGLGLHIRFGTPQHRGRGAHQGFELLRRQGRAVFLPKLQSDADRHHDADDDDRSQVVRIGDVLDDRQNGENDDERVLETGEKLEEPVRRLLARDLVRSDLLQTLGGIGLEQTLRAGTNIGNRGCEVVASFAKGGRRQRRQAVTGVLRKQAILRLGLCSDSVHSSPPPPVHGARRAERYGSLRPRRTADRPWPVIPVGVPAAAPELPAAGLLGPSFISAFCVMRRAAGGAACFASGPPTRDARRLSVALVPALRPAFPRPARSAIGIRACRSPAPKTIDTRARIVPPAAEWRREAERAEKPWNGPVRAPPDGGGGRPRVLRAL